MKDRASRIEELEAELRARGASFYVGDDFDEGMRESFLERVLAFEEEPTTTVREALAARGREVPDDLWALIAVFAELHIVLDHTDHLDDAQLLQFLRGCLDEPIHVASDPGTVMHIDVVGSGSDEDTAAYLRYYASRQEWRRWKREFPDEEIPPRERPPFDRDRLLPRAGEASQRTDH